MVTISEGFGQNIWQMEEVGPHAGKWSRISGEMARNGYALDIQSNLPRVVSADSDGIARIIPSLFTTWSLFDITDAELRYEISHKDGLSQYEIKFSIE